MLSLAFFAYFPISSPHVLYIVPGLQIFIAFIRHRWVFSILDLVKISIEELFLQGILKIPISYQLHRFRLNPRAYLYRIMIYLNLLYLLLVGDGCRGYHGILFHLLILRVWIRGGKWGMYTCILILGNCDSLVVMDRHCWRWCNRGLRRLWSRLLLRV